MKTFTKSIFIIALTACSFLGYAQSFTLKGGATYSNFTFGGPDAGFFEETFGTSTKYKTGFTAGVSYDQKITENVSLEFGLSWTQMGMKFNEKDELFTFDYEETLNYFQIPVAIKGRATVADNASVYLAAGPYASLGISVTDKMSEQFADEKTSQIVTTSFDDAGYRLMDLGVRGAAGVQWGQLQLELNFNQGISNLIVEEDEDFDFSLKNQSFGLTLGYVIDVI